MSFAQAAPQIGTFGFDEPGMDRSVKPGDDFFAYASGTWFKNTPIPADKPAAGSYILQEDVTNQRIRDILEAAKADPSSKIGRAYASYLDTARVEARGLTPIRPWLDRIKALNDRKDYSALIAEADEMRIGGPVVYWIWQDDKQPAQAMLMIDQAGVGLVDRNMYLDEAQPHVDIRKAYVAHLARLLTLAGEADADASAAAVLALETEIAKVHWPREDAEDMVKTYHKFTIAETAQFSTPTFDLTAILRRHAPKLTQVQIREPSAVKGIATVVDKAPLQVLKDQMIVRSMDGLAEALPAAVESEAFAFYGTLLSGTPAPVINGFTGDQRFFLGWTQFFRIKPRDEYLRQTMLVWRHSPDKQRVWTVRNIDAWYEAFGVKPGDKLYLPPEKRVRVW